MAATAFKPFMTRSEFAAHIGCTKQYVTKLGKENRLVFGNDATSALIDVEKTKRLLHETADPSKAQPEPTDSEEVGKTYHASRAVKEKYLALAARRDYEKSILLLRDAHDVYYKVANAMTICRTSFEQMPDVIAPQLVGINDEATIRNIISDYVLLALNEAANECAKLQES